MLPNTVAKARHGGAPCKILLLQQILSLCQLYFIEITKLREILSPMVLGISWI